METQPQPAQDEATPPPCFRLERLQELPTAQLQVEAASAGLPHRAGMDRQALVFALQTHCVSPEATGTAEGVLDVRPEGFGFLRSPHHQYRAGADDVHLSRNQVRSLGLRTGQKVNGLIRPPRSGEGYFAMIRVEAVDGAPIGTHKVRTQFDQLTPVLPHRRLHLSHPDAPADLRIIDLLVPIGHGQRLVVITPPASGRVELLSHVAGAVIRNDRKTQVVLLLVDQRPEELTDIDRGPGSDPRATVFATTFDEPPERHGEVMNLARARARALVEAGNDVVLLVDGLTQLVRALNTTVPHSGKIICPGLDATSLQAPKALFASARQTEEGPALTVVATLLTATDSPLDERVAEEFASKANAQIDLDADLIAKHFYPAVRVEKSCTRREDLLVSSDELRKTRRLRESLAGQSPEESLRHLLARIESTPNNADLLAEY